MALTDAEKKQLEDLKAKDTEAAEEEQAKKRRDWIDKQIEKDEKVAKDAAEKAEKDEERKKKRSFF